MSNFWLRTATYVVAALWLAAAFVFRGWLFIASFVMLAVAAQYEIQTALTHGGVRPLRLPGYAFALGVAPVYYLLGAGYAIALFFLCFMSAAIVSMYQRQEKSLPDMLATSFTFMYPTVLFAVMLPLAELDGATGTAFLVMAFVCAFMTDTFGYIVGMPLGRHPLAPRISPKKSIEGAIGGSLGGVAGALLIGHIAILNGSGVPLWAYGTIGLAASIADQYGDLFASAIKRYCGVKDFGRFFPGHGGVMDRLDGVYFCGVIVFISSILLGLA